MPKNTIPHTPSPASLNRHDAINKERSAPQSSWLRPSDGPNLWCPSSYTNPSVMRACCSMWSKSSVSMVSPVPWMCGLESSNSDSMTKAAGYPALEAEAWSEQA